MALAIDCRSASTRVPANAPDQCVHGNPPAGGCLDWLALHSRRDGFGGPIKSPDDTFDDILNRCFDYAKLAVQNIPVMDPDNKRAWMFRDHSLILLVGDELRFEWINKARHLHEVALPLTLMFGQLDEQ